MGHKTLFIHSKSSIRKIYFFVYMNEQKGLSSTHTYIPIHTYISTHTCIPICTYISHIHTYQLIHTYFSCSYLMIYKVTSFMVCVHDLKQIAFINPMTSAVILTNQLSVIVICCVMSLFYILAHLVIQVVSFRTQYISCCSFAHVFVIKYLQERKKFTTFRQSYYKQTTVYKTLKVLVQTNYMLWHHLKEFLIKVSQK